MADAELPTIARPYARAVFALALDQKGGLNRWSLMLGLLAAVGEVPAVRQMLDSPRLTTADKVQQLVALAGDDLTQEGQNFVGVLAEHGRLSLLPVVAQMYELLKSHHEKTMDVSIVSAYEISAGQKSELEAALQRRLQRSINLSTSVDKSLIGGVVIKAEDTVIDGSVRGGLQKLSQALV